MDYQESNIKPQNLGNSKNFEVICSPSLPFTLLRYEAIADFYTEEPVRILVQVNENDNEKVYEQIFRYRVWIANRKTYSFLIYSVNRSLQEEDMIIHYVVWNRGQDLKKVKSLDRESQGTMLNEWPNIELKTIYLGAENSSLLKGTILRNLDKILMKGISLKDRKPYNNLPSWKQMEIMRLFDWGQVHSIWDTEMENNKIETTVSKLEMELKKFESFNLTPVYKMRMDYSVYPEVFKSLVQGKRSNQE